MASMDIFNINAFSLIEMSDALNRVPYKPQLLGNLGVFDPKPISTTTFAIEKKDKVLSLVETSERGAPLSQRQNEKADIRDFRTVRVAKASRVNAEELQNIRAFGTESELSQVQDEVMQRMIDVRNDIELTLENMRLGAVQGIVTDADGTVIYNWFNQWGFSQPAEIDFALSTTTPHIRQLCNQVVRGMTTASKGAWATGTQVMALCGDNFWDALTTHPEIRQTYQNTAAAADLRNNVGNPYGQFQYGQILFTNYRGTDDGSTVAVGTDKVKFFPLGAPGVFQHVMSPGETFETVNMPGQPFYSLIVPDTARSMYVDIEVYTYPMFICTRPEMLLRGKA